jgi:FtsP/CotA-like multicopper oxidase with cupredoxin domain
LSQGGGNLPTAVDINPNPNIFETNLVAVEAMVDLGNGVLAKAETFNGSVPGPLFKLKVGDRVIVHFTNNLPEASSIHWHGIEVPAFSDGTGIVQNPVLPPGGTYTYSFIIRRPGVFFYHSHIKPTNQSFKGFYGPIIVEDAAESKLISKKVLPNSGNTKQLVIGDVTVCKAALSNDAATFPADATGTVPWAGTEIGLGNFPGLTAAPTPKDLCETPRDHFGAPLGGPLPAGTIPFIEPAHPGCSTPGGCRTIEGQLIVTNGKVPAARAGSPAAPGLLAPGADVINVKAGEGVRLQLLGATATRYVRLRMTGPTGQPVTLFRVGGQGGLLDRVRVEGGVQGTLDTNFNKGEILLAVAEREDVVFVVPEGKQGDTFTLWTLDYKRIGEGDHFSRLPTVPVAHFQIVGAASKNEKFAIAEGDPLLVHPAVNAPIENLKVLATNPLSSVPAGTVGTTNQTIQLTNVGLPQIDGVDGFLFDEGLPGGDFTTIPNLVSTRFAKIGDVLELTVKNTTATHHPWHAHGFSFQPVRLLDAGGATILEFNYNEFVDLVDIPVMAQLVYRVRIDDRLKEDFITAGGALGRWAMHCHIFFHAGLGMISELVIIP